MRLPSTLGVNSESKPLGTRAGRWQEGHPGPGLPAPRGRLPPRSPGLLAPQPCPAVQKEASRPPVRERGALGAGPGARAAAALCPRHPAGNAGNARVPPASPPPTGCVTLSRSLGFSEPPFSVSEARWGQLSHGRGGAARTGGRGRPEPCPHLSGPPLPTRKARGAARPPPSLRLTPNAARFCSCSDCEWSQGGSGQPLPGRQVLGSLS